MSRAPAVAPSTPSYAPAITPAVVACVDVVETDKLSNNVTMHVPAERSASHENRDKMAIKQAPAKPPITKITAPASTRSSLSKDLRHQLNHQNSVAPSHPAY